MAGRVDWYYHRKGCRTCARADAFLEETGLRVAEQIDARKERMGPKDAIELARSMNELYVMKGKKLVHVRMGKDAPSNAELEKLLIGPSGNLRAPTIRRGKKLFVGFDAEAFRGTLA